MPQSGYGELKVFEDFLAPDDDHTWVAGGGLIGNLSYVSVNEGTFEYTVDEVNGVLAITTDTGDNDNIALKAGMFSPENGGCYMEARFKVNSATLGSVFVGYTETLALDTPVMPAEFATATMTYNGTGGMLGLQLDTDGTAIDFRAVMGDAAAVVSGADAHGTRANITLTADKYYIARVEMYVDGSGACYLGDASDSVNGLKLVKEFNHSTKLTPTDKFYAVLMFENRSAAARVMEVDYMTAHGWRRWNV